MKRHTYILASATSALAVALGAGACTASDDAVAGRPAAADPTSARDGGTLRIGLDRPFGRLDPVDATLTSQPLFPLANAVFDPLMVNDTNGGVRPYLAKGFTPNADATSWTLDLREGVKFSNGAPLDAAAVVAHVNRLAKPDNKCACAADAARIAGLTPVGATSVRFDLKAADATFPNLFTRALGYISAPSADPAAPIGSGPYTVENNQPGVAVTVVRNPSYWGAKGHADKIVYRVLPDADSRYQSVRSGDIDLIWSETPTQYRQAGADGLRAAAAPAATSFAVFNTTAAPFDDVRVRQAMQYAIDRDTLAKVVNLGQGGVSAGPIVSTSPYRAGDAYPGFDPVKARALLAEVGAPVKFDYLVVNTPAAQQRATVIQQMLGDVGIKMSIKPVDNAGLGTALFQHQFQVADFTTSVLGDTDTGLSSVFATGGMVNFASYANPKVTALLASGRASLDPARRGADYNEATKTIVQEAPALFFTENRVGYLASAKVGGLPELSRASTVNLSPASLWLTP
ncbi:ABC transporter substrate-binding protein [Embleya sp. AB8]|uniref:ABC transporter substrate-binding protein n=1 Tax=Embleya sp. AB8 TaxID=3156304 RepID=UPI003C77C11F